MSMQQLLSFEERPKTISVYGRRKTMKPKTYRQRWKKNRKAYSYKHYKTGKTVHVPKGKQRYWKKVTRKHIGIEHARFEFTGKGKEIKIAVAKVMREGWIPIEMESKTTAEKFIEEPEQYGEIGKWYRSERPEIESPWECPECGYYPNYGSTCQECGYVKK